MVLQRRSQVSYEGFDGPFSNVNLIVKGKCSLRTFHKHSKFRYVTTKCMKICFVQNSVIFRRKVAKSGEKREIHLHSFCTVLQVRYTIP